MVPFEISTEQLERDVRAYRQARLGRLKAERGWLTLINKVWLSDGVHVLGSDPASGIVLPSDRAPRRLGTVTVRGSEVTLDIEGDASVFSRGERVRSLVLRSDADPSPDDVTLGSLSFQLLRRDSEFALRVRDADSEARRALDSIPAYPVDPAARIVARLEPFSAPREMSVEDGDGRLQPYLCPGVARFEYGGKSASLLPFRETREDKLFVLFWDLTCRDETYGAGRFLYAPPPVDGHVLLDFNQAFNPPCAFTPYAVCPLPPDENRLDFHVRAGEKRPLASY